MSNNQFLALVAIIALSPSFSERERKTFLVVVAAAIVCEVLGVLP